MRDAVNREIAVDCEIIRIAVNAGATKRQLRKLLSVEKVCRAQMPIALLFARVDRGRLDGGGDGTRKIASCRHLHLAGERCESASHLGDHEMTDDKFDRTV